MHRALTLGAALLAAAALAGTGGNPAGAAPTAPAPSPDALRVAATQATPLIAALGLTSQEKLIVRDAMVDPDGIRHLRYDRTFGGLPVLGGDLIVHEAKSGAVRGVDKASQAALAGLSIKPATTAAAAAAKALAAQSSRGLVAGTKLTAGTSQLVVFAAAAKAALAWETPLVGRKADGTPTKLHVVTDASTGRVLTQWDAIRTLAAPRTAARTTVTAAPKPLAGSAGTGASMYSGSVALTTTLSGSTYQLKDPTRGNQQVNNLNAATSGSGTLYTDADNAWGTGAASNTQTAAVDAAYGASSTWDYYKNVHGRSGIKNNSVGALSKVHYGTAYVNAYWDDDTFSMTYGDGVSNTHPLTSLDVAGHEQSHGVTAATAALDYSGESGGLNEATSDIFGTSVEFYAANSKDVGDYLIGEKIDINGDGTPLRYQDKPSRDGTSPDAWYSGVGNLDVHYSSGPANHFFYLLSEGSGAKTINGVSYNSPTANGVTVTGITRAKAEKIWFRALTTGFTSTTNYAGARTATLAAASALYGATSTEYAQTANAWAGVNVGSASTPPGGGGKSFENTTDVSIPDAGSAVTSSIAVTGVTGNAPSTLAVNVNIVHPYIGDLIVDLIAPDGTVYNLSNRSGGSTANINKTFTVNASSEVANGTWKLRAQDKASADTGYINSWKLTF